MSLLGVLPSYWLYRTPIAYSKNLQATFFSRLKRTLFLFLAVLLNGLPDSGIKSSCIVQATKR
ncbi:MAG: hypothetical protein KJ725_17270 [Gammaproteobacteria bacterium]|nr:hypothetical protein [Gammaproteobacteria bacterium]